MSVQILSKLVRRCVLLLLLVMLTIYVLSAFFKRHRSSIATAKTNLKGAPYDKTVRFQCKDNSDSSGSAELRFMRQNSYACDLAKLDLDKVPEQMVPLTYHSHLDNIDVVCRRKIRMGKLGDGGWEVCDDVDVRPKPPCIVYSFGINRDFSFDDEVARVYGCHVYSFDPSIGVAPHNRSERVHFYDVGLWESTGYTYEKRPKWKMSSFKDIRKMLGHQYVKIDIVKMDIESSEWAALPNMIATGQLDHVNQLYVEYHAPWKINPQTVLPLLKVFQKIEQLDFKKFSVHKNTHTPRHIPNFPGIRTKCYEVHYLKRK